MGAPGGIFQTSPKILRVSGYGGGVRCPTFREIIRFDVKTFCAILSHSGHERGTQFQHNVRNIIVSVVLSLFPCVKKEIIV